MSLDPSPDLSACDREPIHIPGSIQPHGVLLVVGRNSLAVSHAAGDVEGLLGVDNWQGLSLGELIGDPLAGRVARMADSVAAGEYAGQLSAGGGATLDVSAHLSGDHLLVELEPGTEAAPGAHLIARLEGAAAALERTPGLKALCERAAREFRALTGYGRVMVYRFLDDGAGAVVAEERDAALDSFLNHHFPASDIPQQARALYLRNLVRVIPDVGYAPAPLRPAWSGAAPLDMSDCALRSVSPVHIQYLENMDVRASASVSIVVDGALWGMIACHDAQPRPITYELRAACRALAGVLSRQIKAKEAAEVYRDRIRLRSFEDDISLELSRAVAIEDAFPDVAEEMRTMMAADGAAIVRAGEVAAAGQCPPEAAVREIAAWVLALPSRDPFATSRLADAWPGGEAVRDRASGLLAATVSAEEPLLLLWFRAEHVQVVNWAGNPHKAVGPAAGERLTPRASFDAWSETVRGQSRPWSAGEADAAARLARLFQDVRQTRRLRELNLRLSETLVEKEGLLQQKEVLLREVNHRVQNSLQLVSGFLALQSRGIEDETVRAQLGEAQQRVSAVALVHRRLYRGDQIESVDLARYLTELVGEMVKSMGREWQELISLELAPVLLPANRAVTVGLVVTELVINANKYAYGGAPGPIAITLGLQGGSMRLEVSDQGRGRHDPKAGFGTRMMKALVEQMAGAIEYADNRPGLRAVLTAPLA